jgi:hypothetical protein
MKICVGCVIQGVSDVYYIPDLKNNLLSIGQLQEKNLTVVFQPDQCKVSHPKRGLIIQSQMSSSLMFKISVISSTCFVAMCVEATHPWHCIYDHISLKRISRLRRL